MKRSLLKGIAISIVLMTSVSASAQINLGSLGKVLSQTVGTELGSIISGRNNVTKETIAGTWSYQEPAVIFESSNLLKQAGGKVASATIEKKLATQFSRLGITPGKFLITFGSDGTFSTSKNGATTTSGTYTISGTKITFSYLQGTANVSGYAQMEGSKLSLTFDSSKLLGVIGKMGKLASNSSLSTVSSLISSFNGMKTGMAFAKYEAPKTVQTAAATTTAAKTTTATKTTKKATAKKTTAKKTTKKKSTKK
jgi:hypothetical protein